MPRRSQTEYWAPSSSSRKVEEPSLAGLEELKALCAQKVELSDYPLAIDVKGNIPIFDATTLEDAALSVTRREQAMQEVFECLSTGPGVLVVKKMMGLEPIEGACAVAKQAFVGGGETNHQRIFAFNQKHALADPRSFAGYYCNLVLALMSEAWLGPDYQITAQSNSIAKNGIPQGIHRDYHMSKGGPDRARRVPLVTQVMSQLLTLQCAIAHTEQPLSTGPTKFLPFSHHFKQGYVAIEMPEYFEWVEPNMSQLPLERGDAVFFNPAVWHQPGTNVSDELRTMGLFQINSGMSRPMESIDRLVMAKSLWPTMKTWHDKLEKDLKHSPLANGHSNEVNGNQHPRHPMELDALIAATCEGYPSPRNHDHDKEAKIAGVRPDESQAELVRRALKEHWEDEKTYEALEALEGRRSP